MKRFFQKWLLLKPLNFLYKRFDVLVLIGWDMPEVHWMLSVSKLRKEK